MNLPVPEPDHDNDGEMSPKLRYSSQFTTGRAENSPHQQMALGPFADAMTKDVTLGRRGLRDHAPSVSPA
jgi:hypothetical protein